MEVVRQIMDAKKLMPVIALPDGLCNSKVEIIILPAEEPLVDKKAAETEKIVDFLSGIIPDQGKTLDEYRMERLSKYESVN